VGANAKVVATAINQEVRRTDPISHRRQATRLSIRGPATDPGAGCHRRRAECPHRSRL